MCGTNPLKARKKSKTTSTQNGMTTPPTSKMDEKPTFIKKCMKNLNTTVFLATARNSNAKGITQKPEENRYTLDR